MLPLHESGRRMWILILLGFIAISSASVAVVDFVFGFLYPPNASLYWTGGYVLGSIWVLLLLYAIAKLGKRSLWLLFLSPPVLLVIWSLVGIYTCGFGSGCL